jgi:hypothetical protein
MKEQLYNDFVSNVLPKIQDGLTLSYDYFLDLFGRYVTYLFITDVTKATMCFIAVAVLVWFIRKVFIASKTSNSYDNMEYYMVIVLLGFIAIVFLVFGFINTFNAIKAKYIPEVRVYEEIQYMRNMNNSN